MILFIEVIFIFINFIEDRFKHKTLLSFFFIFIAITNLLELTYNILKYYDEDLVLKKKIKDKLKWVSLFHTFLLLILSWMTFVKMKIKTTIFY